MFELRDMLAAGDQAVQHRQPCQLPLAENPTAIGAIDDRSDRVWFDEDADAWVTDFPPPPGFDGVEQRTYGAYGYQPNLTPAERTVILAEVAAEQRAADDAERDAYFFGEDTPSPYPLPLASIVLGPSGGRSCARCWEEPQSGEGEGLFDRDAPNQAAPP